MKTFIKNINHTFQIATLCILFGLPLMSFQTLENVQTITLEESCPLASFSVQNNGCSGPCGIVFNNQSIDASSYLWDFGDGNVSCSENPTHTYENAGTYTVTLRAIGQSCQHEFVGTVDIIQG